jgi:phage shock protein PspC (stress-responsive transcriptional regulator)
MVTGPGADHDGVMTQTPDPPTERAAPAPPERAAAAPPDRAAPAPPARPPLRRSRSNRKIAGVAGGLGRYGGVDPLVVRIILVVLAVYGGSGILIYGLAWLFLAEDGALESPGQQLVNGRAGTSVIAPILVSMLGLVAVGGFFDDGPDFPGAVLLAAVVLAAVYVLRGRDVQRLSGGHPQDASGAWIPPVAGAYGQSPGTAYSPPAAGSATPWATAAPGGLQRAPWAAQRAWSPRNAPLPPPPPPPERSLLGVATFALALLVAGVFIAVDVLTGDAVGLRGALGAALTVLGLGLLIGTWFGRGRSLIAAALLATVTLVSTASFEVPLRGGVGEREWEPDSVAALDSPYRLAAGAGELDLTELDVAPGREVPVEASVALGYLLVRVPRDVGVEITAASGLGEVRLPGQVERNGWSVDRSVDLEPIGATAGTIVLDVEAGIGAVEVRRATS